MSKPMFKCGHAQNGHLVNYKSGESRPCCVICDCTEIIDKPDLSNREARCCYCRAVKPSDSDGLPFFRHWPNREYDEYYCGCQGWN